MPATCSRRLQREGLGIVDVSTREADLEDVFLNLTRGGRCQMGAPPDGDRKCDIRRRSSSAPARPG